jgi:hypothetical protein
MAKPGGPDGKNTTHFTGHLSFRVGSIALLLFSHFYRAFDHGTKKSGQLDRWRFILQLNSRCDPAV